MRDDEQCKFPALPCDRHPASGHLLPDLPPHRAVQARELSEGPDRTLPPGPFRSARPPFPVAGRQTPQRCPQMLPRACPLGTNLPRGSTGGRQRSRNVADSWRCEHTLPPIWAPESARYFAGPAPGTVVLYVHESARSPPWRLRAGLFRWPWLVGVFADECGQHFQNCGVVPGRIVGDALWRVDAAEANVEVTGAELLDRLGVAVSHLPLFGEFDNAAQLRCSSCGEGSVRGQNSNVIYPGQRPGRVLRFLPPRGGEGIERGAVCPQRRCVHGGQDDVLPPPQWAAKGQGCPLSASAKSLTPSGCQVVASAVCVQGPCIFRRGRPRRADPALDILPPTASSRARRSGGHRSQGAVRQSRPRAHTRLRRTDRRCP